MNNLPYGQIAGEPNSTPDHVIPPQVIEALRDGNESAFKRIYVDYFEYVANFIRKLVGSEDDAWDIAQEVFSVIWERHAMLDPQKNIKSYLFTIAKNKALSFLTERKGLNLADFSLQAANGILDDRGASDEVDAEDVQLLVEIALLNMPERRREIFNLTREGVSQAEIAERLNTTKEVVKLQLHHARKEIRELLMLILFFTTLS